MAMRNLVKGRFIYVDDFERNVRAGEHERVSGADPRSQNDFVSEDGRALSRWQGVGQTPRKGGAIRTVHGIITRTFKIAVTDVTRRIGTLSNDRA